ncbi:DNA-binding transcriptional LysR family regulator [Paenalcaligenes hominis]|uniref:DNA-binding transcriptional LysR family regulator n=1 Tax=Paenalcaligenes hominis TaxID=643674 RepID=A0ABX0WRC1_9BURK|nr:LysR substrate-binding domain-containing protein [Paenalcaligenes hominis]NJB65308.1 DNA-binding transcriptional LysR family regulator [Paenalcaligenes hominis]GGE72594.1 regulatory protein [Paenalcaligenes hominis]
MIIGTDWTQRLRLRHLDIILHLAQTGNISHTAQALNMTQPGISRWLKEIEEDIGLVLFERHARGLRPTENGAVLVQHARRIVANLNLTRDDLLARQKEGSGLVNVGSTGAATVETVPMAILELLTTYPKTRVSILEGTMDQLIKKLYAEELDIVVGRSAPELVNDDIDYETLYMEPLQFIARPQHPLAQKTTIQWQDVAQYRWVIWPKNTPIRQDIERALVADKQFLPHDYLESNSTLMNITLLNNSDYISVASARTAKRLHHLNAISILNLPLSGFGSVSMFWRIDATSRLAVTQTIQALRNVSQQYQDRLNLNHNT